MLSGISFKGDLIYVIISYLIKLIKGGSYIFNYIYIEYKTF